MRFLSSKKSFFLLIFDSEIWFQATTRKMQKCRWIYSNIPNANSRLCMFIRIDKYNTSINKLNAISTSYFISLAASGMGVEQSIQQTTTWKVCLLALPVRLGQSKIENVNSSCFLWPETCVESFFIQHWTLWLKLEIQSGYDSTYSVEFCWVISNRRLIRLWRQLNVSKM